MLLSAHNQMPSSSSNRFLRSNQAILQCSAIRLKFFKSHILRNKNMAVIGKMKIAMMTQMAVKMVIYTPKYRESHVDLILVCPNYRKMPA